MNDLHTVPAKEGSAPEEKPADAPEKPEAPAENAEQAETTGTETAETPANPEAVEGDVTESETQEGKEGAEEQAPELLAGGWTVTPSSAPMMTITDAASSILNQAIGTDNVTTLAPVVYLGDAGEIKVFLCRDTSDPENGRKLYAVFASADSVRTEEFDLRQYISEPAEALEEEAAPAEQTAVEPAQEAVSEAPEATSEVPSETATEQPAETAADTETATPETTEAPKN